ncbi:MAG: glucose-1-phosphate thymidylyltransferase RfbA [Eubacteriales bacterium]
MKGIILAAGKGTRLYPITRPVCKPLLPIYDKPLIYYPLATLMQVGISDILIIVPPDEKDTFFALLGDGSQFGISITYDVQHVPRGIADAFLIGKDFIGDSSVCLVLGDNIFYSPTITETFHPATLQTSGATVFGYPVEDPRPFGVVEFDGEGNAISIEEKPEHPKSNYIVPGIYFYDNQVVKMAETLPPSARGELEITDINLLYLQQKQLKVIPFDQDFIWLDAGTADSLIMSALTIKDLQNKTGKQVACLEEIAYEQGLLTLEQVHNIGEELKMTLYGQYLKSIQET